MKRSGFRAAFLAAFPKTLPVMAGYLVLGFGFGLLLESRGYSFLWAVLMSVTIYGGSMQFVGIDLLSSGASLLTTAVMTLLVQARHLFYGISMLTRYRGTGAVKPYLIFGLTDETYSLTSSTEPPEGVGAGAYFFTITLLDQIYWVVGSALGGLFGQFVSINTTGVDFAMTALFVVILTDKLTNKESRVPALIGLAVSFVCLLIFGPANFLIPSMIGITVALFAARPLLDRKEGGEQ